MTCEVRTARYLVGARQKSRDQSRYRQTQPGAAPAPEPGHAKQRETAARVAGRPAATVPVRFKETGQLYVSVVVALRSTIPLQRRRTLHVGVLLDHSHGERYRGKTGKYEQCLPPCDPAWPREARPAHDPQHADTEKNDQDFCPVIKPQSQGAAAVIDEPCA